MQVRLLLDLVVASTCFRGCDAASTCLWLMSVHAVDS